MFSSLVFASVLLHVTYVGSDRCPILAQIGPCQCTDWPQGMDVFCNGNLVGKIRGALANVANTKQRIFHMKLKHVWLPNLPPNLLRGHDVNRITIENCNTSSVDEDAFADMAATLKVLSLCHNALERVPSQALEKCLNLTQLYLDNNRIEILHAEAFMGLDSLLDLSLIGNRIKFIDNSAFVGIGRHFKDLNLGGNELTAVPCLQLRNQSSLEYLYLENNKITSLLPDEFHAMGGESFKGFTLVNNTIRHLPANVFKSMKNLRNLILWEDGIESIHPSAFEGIEDTLLYLSLGYNRLEEVPSVALKNMRVLISVGLDGNKICKIRKEEFLTYGKSITDIHLSNNLLAYLDANAFVGLHSLNSLNLKSNQLKTLSFETISPVSGTIEWIDIEDNPLHCDCNLRWMKSRASWLESIPEDAKCVTPERYANVLLADIKTDQLVCDANKTSNPTEPCCNCFSNSQQHVSSSALSMMLILQISFIYLLNAVLEK